MTESKRQRQIAKQVQKDLGEIFQKELRSVMGQTFVTITDVKVTPDLAIARVYLSFLMVEDKEELLQKIRENTKMIRLHFGQKARHQLRIVPDFQFYIDDTAEYAQKIEGLFAGLEIPDEEESLKKLNHPYKD
jgi:ribosome-binding factor A